MSWHVLSWVADHSPTKGPARLLLVMMADMANDEGWLEAKTSTLAKRCNADSERAIQKHLKALSKAGAIEVIPQVADSGRSLNNAFIVLTPGRVIPEFRSRPPRVSKRSPHSDAPRVSKRSPSPPDQTDTLSPSKRSPSPRPNVHPHKGTVLQEPFYSNHPQQQQQQQAAREAARPANPSPPAGWIDFDPKSRLQRSVVERVEELTPGGSDDERREMLRTLSHTPDEGAVLEGSLRQAKARWLGMTLATAARFEREGVETDEAPA